MATGIQVTFDCAEPVRMAEFWTEALGYRQSPPPEGFDTWEAWARGVNLSKERFDQMRDAIDPDGKGPRLLFQKVPEPKTVKNRVHLDLNVGAGLPAAERRPKVESEVARLEKLGATQLRVAEEEHEFWVVMADPEGNEFCVQ